LEKDDGAKGGCRESDARGAAVRDPSILWLQKVCHSDLALERSNRREREAARVGGITCGVDDRVRYTLEVLVDDDAFRITRDTTGLQIERIDIWHAAGPMYRSIGLDIVGLPVLRLHGDDKLTAAFRDAPYRSREQDGDIELARCW